MSGKETGSICGPRLGKYSAPMPVDDLIKRWVSCDTERSIKPPKLLRCEHPRHAKRKTWFPRGECYAQQWQLTSREVNRAVKNWDMFSLSMPPRILCPECAKAVRREVKAGSP